MKTKALENGNTQAERIPVETAYQSTNVELDRVRI